MVCLVGSKGEVAMSWGELKHNSCRRCRGTMGLDRDRYGTFFQCLQCGYIIDRKALPLISRDELAIKIENPTGISLMEKGTESINAA